MPPEAQKTQAFALTPHPAVENPAPDGIGGRVSRTLADIRVTYVLEGRLENLDIPEPAVPRFADELWRHTCFELFIAHPGGPAYYEFNFSPSGEWAVYAFGRYRERMPLAAGLAPIDPRVSVRRSSAKLELNAAVPLYHLDPADTRAALVLALSAVIEARDGSLSYWALRHPSDKPDFHHRDAFILELDEIRN